MPAIRAGGKERCRQWLISHYAQMTPARRARNACDIRRNRVRCRAINISGAWTGICVCFFYLTNQRMIRRLYQSHQPPIRREPLRLRRIFFLTTLCLLRILSIPARHRWMTSHKAASVPFMVPVLACRRLAGCRTWTVDWPSFCSKTILNNRKHLHG